MIVSTTKKFVFVHIYKTGGSTITRLLAPYTDSRLRLPDASFSGPGWQEGWHFEGAQHARLDEESRSSLLAEGVDVAQLFVFSFVRNPYSWLLSIWSNFFRQPDSIASIRFGELFPERSFRDYIHFLELSYKGEAPRAWGAFTQSSFIPESIKEPDFIGRFETYEKDLRSILTRLDLDAEELPHENQDATVDKEHFEDFYDTEMKRIVRNILYEDFERFGYAT